MTRAETAAPPHQTLPAPVRPSRSTRVLIVGGKGGVGKTTCAATLALAIARDAPDRQVLLVSTDPAHSIGDVLAQPVGEVGRRIRGGRRGADPTGFSRRCAGSRVRLWPSVRGVAVSIRRGRRVRRTEARFSLRSRALVETTKFKIWTGSGDAFASCRYMRILVSNDDGVYSPGIAVLAQVASEFSTVRVVAPDVERSSMGHAITSSRPLSFRQPTFGT